MIHSYPWYFADWLQSEARFDLSLSERGLYRDLLDLCYQDGSIPSDERRLRLMAACGDDEFTSAWEKVKNLFEERDGRLYNEKVSGVRGRIEQWHEGKRQAGRKGGTAKAQLKHSYSFASSKKLAQLEHSYDSASSKSVADPWPTTTTTTTTINPLPPLDEKAQEDPIERITAIGKSWPNKSALEMGKRLIAEEVAQSAHPLTTLTAIEQRAQRWAEFYRSREPQFRKRLDNWMRDGDWMNDPEQAPAKPAEDDYDGYRKA